MADDPGKKIGEYASRQVKNKYLDTRKWPNPNEGRGTYFLQMEGEAAQAKNEAEDEVKREMRGVKKAKGGKVSSASKRADGCATKGKTRGRMI